MNLNDSPTLLRNDSGDRNNWLGLELVGVESNRDAIGTGCGYRPAAWNKCGKYTGATAFRPSTTRACCSA